jgi:hypothetical protein
VKEAIAVEAASGDRLFEGSDDPSMLPGSLARLLCLDGVNPAVLTDEAVPKVRHGNKLSQRLFSEAPMTDGLFALLDSGGKLIGIASHNRGVYHYQMVL